MRLAAAFRFDAKEVFIGQNPETGDVILSRKPADWAGFLTTLKGTDIAADFLGPADRDQRIQSRDPLAGLDD